MSPMKELDAERYRPRTNAIRSPRACEPATEVTAAVPTSLPIINAPDAHPTHSNWQARRRLKTRWILDPLHDRLAKARRSSWN